MTCDTINAKNFAHFTDLWSFWVSEFAILVPPPPPPPPPPHPDPSESVADYLERVVSWQKEELLPALEGACSS